MKLKILASTLLFNLLLLCAARADIITGLVGYWTLDAGSGALAADSSPSSPANHGTLTQFADAALTTTWTNGWFNNAVVFNQNGETTNYIGVPSSASLNMPSTNKQWTLAAWVKPSVAGSSQPNDTGIICKGTFDKEAFAMSLYQGKIRAKMRNAAGGGGFTITGTTALKAGTWYHVVATAMVPKGTNNSGLIVYVNGVRETGSDANTYTTMYSSTQPVTIGTRANSSGTLLGFQGTIDDVRVYSRLLGPSDVLELYTNNAPGSAHLPAIANSPRDVTCYSNDTAVFSVGTATTNSYVPLSYQWCFNAAPVPGATAAALTVPGVTSANEGLYTVVVSNYAGAITSAPGVLTVRSLPPADPTSGLVGWWKMDDANGSAAAADSSGNGNAGTLASFTDTTTVWVDGQVGGALGFNGDGSAANVVAIPGIGTPAPAALDFNATPVFTLAAWVNASLLQSNQAALITKGTGGGGEQFCLDINGANYRFFVRDTNGTAFSVPTSGPFNGFWQHVAAVVNATNGLMNLYINGALVGSGAAPFSLLATNHEISIGNRQSGTAAYNLPFTGMLDDVRVYSRDLTSADVYALYAQAAYPIITAQNPATPINTLYQGASPTYRLATVTGAFPFSYQWFTNGVLDPAAISSSYQFHNLPLGSINLYCIVTNPIGSATSIVWTASVVAAPTAPYSSAVLADGPIGFWRLNETPDDTFGNNGVVANDYWGGNGGVYLNTILAQTGYSQGLSNQFGYYPASDPNGTSALFGSYNGGASNYVSGIAGVDFATPLKTSGAFSIEAWTRGDTQTSSAGIVAKGAWGAEQFTLDTGGTAHSYRFTIRDAAKSLLTVGNTNVVPDGNWHHLVGVLDEPNSNLCLYVDGVRVATTVCPPSNGVYSTTIPMSIGCRLGNSPVGYNQQFFGHLNEVAIYKSALSSNQVVAHYLAAGFPPAITQNPALSTNVNEATTLVVPAQGGGGSPPVSYQWYDVTYGMPGTPLVGQTNTTLVISNISATAYNGRSLALRVSNAFKTVYSSSVFVIVNTGAPAVMVAPSAVTVYVGASVAFKVAALGTEPFTYQWSVDGSDVPGATGVAYTNTAGVGARTVVCNVAGPGGSGSGSSTLTGLTPPSDSYASLVLADQPVAYWRLDEPVNSSVANDYVGGHIANYSFAVNGLPGFGSSNPNTAAGFGMNGVTSGSMALEQANSGVPLIDLSTMGANASFSVEAWVKAPSGQSNGGIVAKGYGHAEQFTLDAYGNAFRFYGRDPSNNTHGPTSSAHPDGLWHHLVGVYNGTNGLINLFVDGTVQGSATMTPGLGILPTTVPTSIGARTSSSTDAAYSLQLSNAVVDEVAIYPYALTTNQVEQHYAAAAIPPQLVKDLPPQVFAYAGFPLSLSVSASSTTPMTYQWQRDGVNLTDGPSISGANSNVLTLSPAEFATGNTFQAFITNQATPIATRSTQATLTILPQLGFNGFGVGWTSSGSPGTVPQYIAANVLRLTDGGTSEAASSFFSYPVYVGGFLASFTYQDLGVGGADGMAFVVQNDSRGAAARGGGGGGLGYNGITNSAALEFNIYANNTVGYAVRTNGVTGKPYISALPVNLASGNPIAVNLQYLHRVLSLTMTDAVASASFTTNVDLDIPGAVGALTAYVGFTGGDGTTTSTQTVSNFSFVSLPDISIQAAGANQVVVSWLAAAGGAFALQQCSSLGAGWTTVGGAATRVDDRYQVTLAVPAGASTFYRLVNVL